MNRIMCITTLIYVILRQIHGSNVAKEVEGGVQILHTGPIELILPETLSFTLKRLKRSQLCIGDFVICYEASTTIMLDERFPYYNLGGNCPLGYCTLMAHPETAYYMKLKRGDDVVIAQLHDEYRDVCPRKVVDKRQKFLVRELPDCPVVVNGASLPKDTETNKTSSAAIVGIIVGCVMLILLLTVIIVVVYCVCIRSNRHQAPHAKSDSPDQRATKSPATSLRGRSPYD